MRVSALIVAAGRGSRARFAGSGPKQYSDLGGIALIARTIQPFLDHPGIDSIQVVIHRDDRALYEAATASLKGELMAPVFGGASRQESVLAGLKALADTGCDRVLIHDAARPFVSFEIISGVLEGLETSAGCIAAIPVADTLKRATSNGNKAGAVIEATVPREGLWRAQTPQGFDFKAILDAHQSAAESGKSGFTDDASIAEWAGLQVMVSKGSAGNDKITSAEDLLTAQQTLSETAMEPRVGTGFDVHRFGPGASVWLCGVEIAHNKSLEGHSDADVGLHALTDAILGALGDGDIGQHFPPSDPEWKGARSDIFLKDAGCRVAKAGGRIANVDVTLLCEEPKVGPHRERMRKTIADILEIDISRVGVKATTTERLGFTGRGEGIAAMASAMILLAASN